MAKSESKEVEVVRFVGPQHERSFSKKDLNGIDPEFGGSKVSFNAENGFSVPVSELSDLIVETLKSDEDFVVESEATANKKVADKQTIARTMEEGNSAFVNSGTGFQGTGSTVSARTPSTIGDAT